MGKTDRGSKRTLVRWNDDHDKELLLWINYCCTEQGIKIPFARVAQCLGPNFTEGACIQHLAKIRNKMEQAGLHVPPAQKRGTTTRTGSSIYRPKAKDINAPVPRVRPVTAPSPGDYSLFGDEDEDEEEDHLIHKSDNLAQNKPTRRQPAARKKTTTRTADSEDDDDLPVLYDSDNEYGARKPKSVPEIQGLSNSPDVQSEFHSGVHAGAMEIDTEHDDTDMGVDGSSNSAVPASQSNSRLKFESIEDAMNSVTVPQPAQPRGTRRKSSAMTADDDDEEYGGPTKDKGRKKPAAARAPKKAKIDNKSKNASKKKVNLSGSAAPQDDDTRDADHIAMPPPRLPINKKFNTGWNTDFINQPFAPAGSENLPLHTVRTDDHLWNDFSASSSNFAGVGTFNDFGDFAPPAGGNSAFSAYQMPAFNYGSEGLSSTDPSPTTRNHSFASASSHSTVASQPTTWNYPVRSPGFPNPQEATMALQAVLNRPNADDPAQINNFELSVGDQDLHIDTAGIATDDETMNDILGHMNNPNSMGEWAQSTWNHTNNDIDFTEYLHDG